MSIWDARLRQAEAHLKKADPKLEKLINKFGSSALQPHTEYYGQLVDAIIGQQLSEKAGATILKRLMGLFGDKLPSPEEILRTDDEKLRAIGSSYAKASYMKDLAQHIIDERLDLEHIATLPNDTVIEQLTAVKGIGEWTAHMFMIFSLGRLDILPTGDLGIRKAMQNLYGLKSLPLPKEMHKIARKYHWSPYESVASWYLWKSLDNANA